MTKYILVGGRVQKAADDGQAFCEELVKGFNEPVKILDCLFAEEESLWPEKFAKDKVMFEAKLPGKKFNLELAQEATFLKQVAWADAIFLRGGSTDRLIEKLNQDPAWIKLLGGKTLAGTSAGADAIAKYYYSLDDLNLKSGLGLLPIKVLVHYRSDYNAPNIDWDKSLEELKNFQEPLELITLAEGQFVIK